MFPKSLWNAAFGEDSARNRPLGNISFALNYYFHGYEIYGYHIVNIVIHLLSAIFLFLFINLTFDTPALRNKYSHPFVIAAIGAIIWLVHPLHTQSVTYIVQRLNSAAAMLYMASFYFFIRGRFMSLFPPKANISNEVGELKTPPQNCPRNRLLRNLCFAAAFVFWIISLGFKQITVTLPVFVYLYEWFFFQNLNVRWLKRSLIYLSFIILAVVTISYIFLGFEPLERFNSITDFKNKEFTLVERLLTQPRVVVYYLSLIIYPNPSRLNLDYDFPLSMSLLNPITTFFAIIFILGTIILAIYFSKKESFLSFAIFWFYGNLIIESSIVPIAIIFEHRTYLPSMLLVTVPVIYLFRILNSYRIAVGILCLPIILLCVWTYQRNAVWTDPVAFWTDCVNKSPKKARPRSNLARVLIALGQTDLAIDHLKKALQMRSDLPAIHLNLGEAFFRKGDLEAAKDSYLNVLELSPKSKKAYVGMAKVLTQQGQANEAVRYYQMALKINPDYAAAYNSLGILFSDLGQTEEAIHNYRMALQKRPDFAEPYNNLAIELVKLGRLEDAKSYYLKALQIDPNYYEGYNNFGILLTKIGKTEEAIEAFEKAIELNPDYAEAYMSLGVAAQQNGRLEAAIAYWQKAVSVDPKHAEAHYNLGIAFQKIGKLDSAVYHFTECLRVRPDFADAHNSLGAALIQTGRVDPAIEHFQRALALDPDHADARKNLEKARTIMDRVETDIRRLENAQRQNPNDPIAYFRLGELYFDIGRWDAAVDQYRKALQLDPGLAPALNNLALAYKRNEQYDEARVQFEKMITRWPEHAAGYYNLACVYALQNDAEKAMELLQKAIDKGYDNWEQIKTDPDLNSIRDSAAYQALIRLRAEED
jgi:tetratricopeptide (TPR) repeat protein